MNGEQDDEFVLSDPIELPREHLRELLRAARQNAADEKPPSPAPPKLPLISGLFTFPCYPRTLGVWIGMSLGLTLNWIGYCVLLGPAMVVGVMAVRACPGTCVGRNIVDHCATAWPRGLVRVATGRRKLVNTRKSNPIGPRTPTARGWLLLLVSLFSAPLAGCSSQPLTAPATFMVYDGKNGSFTCEYPEGWNAEGGGSRNLYWAKFTQETALIRVNTDLTGSLFGSLAQSANTIAGTSDVEELSPVAQVHPLKLEQMKEEYGAYEEESGSMVATGLGSAWSAEFTAKDSFGRALHGYRTTALSRDLRITMVCVCREDDWQTLQPAFQTVIASLSSGKH